MTDSVLTPPDMFTRFISKLAPPVVLNKGVKPRKWNEEELLFEEDPPLESDWHVLAMVLLLDIMQEFFKDRDDVYMSGNTPVYFDPARKKNRHFRAPDFYVIKNAPKGLRHSWVTWEEGGLTPHLVIELASLSTIDVDLGEKKEIYEQQLKIPEYLVFNPYNDELLGWRLQGGHYCAMKPNEQGWFWCEEVGLWLGVIDHEFPRARGVIKTPRFFHPDGQLVLTRQEVETQRAKVAEAEIARLQALLKTRQ
jgi:Uma2 family endonuclease